MTTTKLQRKCACGQSTGGGECSECRKKRESALQRAPLSEQVAGSVPPVVHEVLGSPGRLLDANTRSFMEPRFGHDFSNVRVHTDNKAAESASAVNAQAYTVGRDVVFGAGLYAPEQRAGQQLLAHELTHVVQQSTTAAPPGDLKMGEAGDHFEQEAERNAGSILQAPVPGNDQQQAAPGVLQRDPLPVPSLLPPLNIATDTVSLGAGDQASVENPKLISLAAAFKSAAANNPGGYIKLSTYLSEAAKLSSARSSTERVQLQQRMIAIQQALVKLGVPAESVQIEPATAYSAKGGGEITANLYKTPQAPAFLLPPPVAGPATVPAATGPGGPSLSDMLSFKFNAGPLSFAVELPKSVTAKLPVSLGAAKSLDFELKAESSGDFSFSIALNGYAHVRIAVKAALKVDKDKGTSGAAGLEISTMRTVCNAPSPESLKAKITAAGAKLTKAMKELETAKPEDRLPKLIDIGGAIGEMYDAVEKAKGGCKEVPAATFNFGVQAPLSPSDAALNDPDPLKRPSTFIGGSITIPFGKKW